MLRPTPILEGKEAPVSVIHHSLPSGPYASARARVLVLDDLAEALGPSKVAAAQLMASELVTNAVQHAGLFEGDLIGLDILVDPQSVYISVVDGGPGIGSERGHTGNDPGGWGLVLVDRISDRWGIQRNHPHTVWFEIDR
jgi:anti-sigma regulatory factor (Ser/Thr protein kinase)